MIIINDSLSNVTTHKRNSLSPSRSPPPFPRVVPLKRNNIDYDLDFALPPIMEESTTQSNRSLDISERMIYTKNTENREEEEAMMVVANLPKTPHQRKQSISPRIKTQQRGLSFPGSPSYEEQSKKGQKHMSSSHHTSLDDNNIHICRWELFLLESSLLSPPTRSSSPSSSALSTKFKSCNAPLRMPLRRSSIESKAN